MCGRAGGYTRGEVRECGGGSHISPEFQAKEQGSCVRARGELRDAASQMHDESLPKVVTCPNAQPVAGPVPSTELHSSAECLPQPYEAEYIYRPHLQNRKLRFGGGADLLQVTWTIRIQGRTWRQTDSMAHTLNYYAGDSLGHCVHTMGKERRGENLTGRD